MGGSGSGIFGKGAPAAPNYSGSAMTQAASSAANTQGQTTANRPNQQGPNTQVGWQFDPSTGQWTQSAGFQGPLGGANTSLQQQTAQNFSQPVQTGDAARKQAIQASYDASTARLDPQWRQNDASLKANLANEGLDPNSEAARTANMQETQAKNDAFQGAMNEAIKGGTAAQQATFNENLAARNAPLEEMGAMGGLFKEQPGFMGAGRGESEQDLAAAMAQGNYQLPAAEYTNQANADVLGGGMQLVKSFMPFGFGGQ